jgi:hypothetical protein
MEKPAFAGFFVLAAGGASAGLDPPYVSMAP